MRSAAAEILLNAAILGPCLWVNRFTLNLKIFRWIFTIFWLFNFSAAILGVLQARYPGSFEPKISTLILEREHAVDTYSIELDTGEKTWRPFGFSDVPGGAAASGVLAVLFSINALLSDRSRYYSKILAVMSILAGISCIFLCQIRSSLIVTAVGVLILSSFYGMRGDWKRSIILLGTMTITAIMGYITATSMASEAVSRRFSTLVESDSSDLYYKSRGVFLEHAFTGLADFPLGAGLGRSGMMNAYFGDNSSEYTGSLWAELQWESWLYDGGLPLMVLYFGLILRTLFYCYKIATSKDHPEFNGYASVLFAWTFAIISNTFSYSVFLSQTGLEFWFIISCFVATVDSETHSEGREYSPLEPVQ